MRPRAAVVPLAMLLLTSASCSDDGGEARHPVDAGGGRELAVRCAGEGPAPTVVLEAGLGTPAAAFDGLVEEIEANGRVCRYDRAGLGDSDPPAQRTVSASVDDLERWTDTVLGDDPFVLVASSYGGLIARLFAAEEPERIAALVLIDATSPDVLAMADLVSAEQRSVDFFPKTAEPTPYEDALRFAASQPAPDLGATPVVVLARETNPFLAAGYGDALATELEARWQTIQRSHLDLSTASRLVVARGAGHDIVREKPELVVATVRQVLADLRQ